MSYVLHGTTGTRARGGFPAAVRSSRQDRGGSGSRIQPTAHMLGVASNLPDQLTQTLFDSNKRICVVLE